MVKAQVKGLSMQSDPYQWNSSLTGACALVSLTVFVFTDILERHVAP